MGAARRRTRRAALLAGLVVLAAVPVAGGTGSAASAAAPGDDRLGVFVFVVDGLRPQEIGPLTPSLAAFRDGATSFEASRSVMVAETIPNHVAMMTGVYPDRSNIPVNEFWDRSGEPKGVDLSDPAELTADTLFTVFDRACPDVSTAAVMSKRYLYEIFRAGGQNVAPDFHWQPEPLIADDFAPAVLTTDVVVQQLPERDFMFVNLGDVDRAGHFDESGPILGDAGLSAVRRGALEEVDLQLGRFVQALQDAGRWERSVVVVLSDHGFDWSLPDRYVTLTPTLEAAVPGKTAAIAKGGAASVYLLDPDAPDADATLVAARQAVLGVDGVEHAWYVQPNPLDPAGDAPADLRIRSRNAGDLLVTVEQGWRASDPTPQVDPVPGNHGHLAARQGTFMVGGGAPFLAPARSVAPSDPAAGDLVALPEQSETVDVAPTVAWLLGLPTDGYDGRVLRDAFTGTEPPSTCGTLTAAGAGGGGAPATTGAPATGGAGGAGGATGRPLPATGGGAPVAGLGLAVLGGGLVAVWALGRRRGHP